MRISVIIPVLNEEKTIRRTIEDLKLAAPEEILVVDGGSADRTQEIVTETGVRLLRSAPGRAVQMNLGAASAEGEVLLFLHADTTLPATAMDDIRTGLTDPRCIGGRFDVKLDGKRWIFQLIGTMISLRSRLTRVATGDQALFVRRNVFHHLGGFPEIPLMEDIAFSRMLKRQGRVACLKSRVITSARRWESEGVWRTILRMWALKLLFFAGVSPSTLRRFSDDAR